MSQQIMSIVSIVRGAFDEMSDIQFLSIKKFGNKLRSNEGFKSVVGDLATLTATSGKDMYIASAKVVFFVNTTNQASIADEVVLKINGIIVETAKFSHLTTSNVSFEYEFKNIGHKVAALEIIKLEVITLDAQVDVEGFIECFEETTGQTPQIPPLNPV